MVRKLGLLVQAHMGSTRLPNKMLKNLCGKTVIGHVISRLQCVKNADDLVIATSDLPADDELVQECENYGVKIFRGSDDDVLARFYSAAVEYNFTDIVRVCADNTLIDWNLIDREIKEYKKHDGVIVIPGRNVPLGLGVEIISLSMLKDAFEHGKEHYHREHVTPYIYENYKNVIKVDYERDYSKFRLTLDTFEDWQLIEKIYNALYKEGGNINFYQVADILKKNPSWLKLNMHVKQKGDKD